MNPDAVAWLEDQFDRHWRLRGEIWVRNNLKIFAAPPPRTNAGRSVHGGSMLSLKESVSGGEQSHWCNDYTIVETEQYGLHTANVIARCVHRHWMNWLRITD